MRLNRVLLAVVLLGMVGTWATAAKADDLPPGDPRVGSAGDPPGDPQTIITTDFTISSLTGTSPVVPNDPTTSPCVLTQFPGFPQSQSACFFRNEITNDDSVGMDINFLRFTVPVAEGVTCTTEIEGAETVWGSCDVTSDSDSSTVTFSDGVIPYNTTFVISLDGFTGPITTDVHANVPESSTLLMLGMSLLALVGLGRKRIFQLAE